MTEHEAERILKRITHRYGLHDPWALERVLSPRLIPIKTLDKAIFKSPEGGPWRATFSIDIQEDWQELMQPGRTGKFVPGAHVTGGVWKEIAKGRILTVNTQSLKAEGEVYVGSSTKAALEAAVEELTEGDFLEIDQYGAAAKVLSALVEYSLARKVSEQGFIVRRMPEDVARHVGAYYYYDFEFERDGEVKRVEVKSIWGTDTRYARLIHSKSKEHLTSSCKFDAQDIFAVSLFLRTGNIEDFAFAKSVPYSESTPYGLPPTAKYPDYVHQNPRCEIGNGSWFATVDEVWDL